MPNLSEALNAMASAQQDVDDRYVQWLLAISPKCPWIMAEESSKPVNNPLPYSPAKGKLPEKAAASEAELEHGNS